MKSLANCILGLVVFCTCLAQVAFGAIKGGEDTILVYDANTYKGASWKTIREADTVDGEACFRSVTGWDRTNVVLLGYTRGSRLLIRSYKKGNWSSKTLPIEGYYATYRAQFCEENAFLFAYDGRGGTFVSLYQGATETKLGDWSGLARRGSIGMASMYRFGDKTFIHPCRSMRAINGNDPQVFVSDGAAIESLSRSEKGYYIQDPTGKDAGMMAGSITSVKAPTDSTRVGVCNYDLLQTANGWRTAVVTLRDGVWVLDNVLPFDTGMVSASWAHSERELVICGSRGLYIYDKGQTRSVNLSEVPLCAWGKNLEDFFVLTGSGSVFHFAKRELQQEVVGPDLKRDASATTEGTHESLKKLTEGNQQFSSAWVSPEGVIYAVRTRDLYSLEPIGLRASGRR